jgi:hypothetical protein
MQHPQAYVAQGENGLLKVGCTSNFPQRYYQLRAAFRAKGDALVRHHVCDRIEAARSVEMGLISACRKRYAQHSGREWFVDGDFDSIVALAISKTDKWRNHKYPTPPTAEEYAAYAARIWERASAAYRDRQQLTQAA